MRKVAVILIIAFILVSLSGCDKTRMDITVSNADAEGQTGQASQSNSAAPPATESGSPTAQPTATQNTPEPSPTETPEVTPTEAPTGTPTASPSASPTPEPDTPPEEPSLDDMWKNAPVASISFFNEIFGFFGASFHDVDDILEAFGEPTTREGARWYFPQGFEIDVAGYPGDTAGSVIYELQNYTYISRTCALKTRSGIGIGSSRSEVMNASYGVVNADETNDTQIAVGSFFSGVYFIIENDAVSAIYISSSSASDQFLHGFYPDREVGVPYNIVAINELTTGEPGLFYLGQSRADIFQYLIWRHAAIREYPRAGGGSVMTADEFIFVFDADGAAVYIAADALVSPRYTVRRTSLYVGLNWPAARLWDNGAWYGENYRYTESYVETDDIVPDYGVAYRMYTFDMGQHLFFVCSAPGNYSFEETIRWGICLK